MREWNDLAMELNCRLFIFMRSVLQIFIDYVIFVNKTLAFHANIAH